jgi:hypothetical protein
MCRAPRPARRASARHSCEPPPRSTDPASGRQGTVDARAWARPLPMTRSCPFAPSRGNRRQARERRGCKLEAAKPADVMSAIILLRNSVIMGIAFLREGRNPCSSRSTGYALPRNSGATAKPLSPTEFLNAGFAGKDDSLFTSRGVTGCPERDAHPRGRSPDFFPSKTLVRQQRNCSPAAGHGVAGHRRGRHGSGCGSTTPPFHSHPPGIANCWSTRWSRSIQTASVASTMACSYCPTLARSAFPAPGTWPRRWRD